LGHFAPQSTLCDVDTPLSFGAIQVTRHRLAV
jgi:hypothetical protein